MGFWARYRCANPWHKGFEGLSGIRNHAPSRSHPEMKPFAIAALAATALTVTACGEKLGAAKPLNVVSGHIVMGATPDRPAVGYFRVQGGPQPVELVAVTADLAQRVEMHESVRENGM